MSLHWYKMFLLLKEAESPAVKKITARRTLSSSSSSSLPGHLTVKRADSTASNSSFLSRQGEYGGHHPTLVSDLMSN